MKEGLFKKITIGVVVSLASTAIIAVVSGLFSGNTSSGSNGDVCAHETRTTGDTIAPTCTVGGVQGMVRCLDCGEITVEGGELPPTGHTGEIGETCTVCNEPIYGQYQNPNFYSLQDIEVGEKVTGNWYRFQLDDGSGEFGWFDYVLGITDGTDVPYTIWPHTRSLWIDVDFYSDLIPLSNDFPVFEFLGTDGCHYVDVCFSEGVSITRYNPYDYDPDTGMGTATLVFDEDVEVKGDGGAYVKRIVFSD